MHHVERIFLDNAAYSPEVSEIAAHAHKLHVRVNLFKPFDTLQMFLDKFYHARALFRRREVVVFEEVCKRNAAELQSFGSKNVLSAVINKLCASAADVHNEALRDIQAVDNSLIHQ